MLQGRFEPTLDVQSDIGSGTVTGPRTPNAAAWLFVGIVGGIGRRRGQREGRWQAIRLDAFGFGRRRFNLNRARGRPTTALRPHRAGFDRGRRFGDERRGGRIDGRLLAARTADPFFATRGRIADGLRRGRHRCKRLLSDRRIVPLVRLAARTTRTILSAIFAVAGRTRRFGRLAVAIRRLAVAIIGVTILTHALIPARTAIAVAIVGAGRLIPTWRTTTTIIVTRIIAATIAFIAIAIAIGARRITAISRWLFVALIRAVQFAFVAIILVTIVRRHEIITPRARLLLFKTRAAFGQYAKVMIRKLQIIFGRHTIALHLRIAGQCLIFLMELGGIAARAIVDAITALGAPAIATIGPRRTTCAAATATTTAVLTIVDQLSDVLATRGIGSPLPTPGQPRICSSGQRPESI
jgi:hypothetical protein